MIPIVSFSNAVSFFFCVIAAAKLYSSWRKTRDPRIGYFLKFYIFLGIFFGFLSTPGIVFFDPFIIELVSLELGLFFLYIAVAYFLGIPIELLGYKKTQQIVFWVIVALAVFVAVLTITSRHSAVIHKIPPFIYVQDQRGILINFTTGIVAAGGAFLSAFLFYLFALRSSISYVRHRSFLIAAGMLVLGITAVTNYVFGGSPEMITASLVSGFSAILGLILILIGIYHHHKEEVSEGRQWAEG